MPQVHEMQNTPTVDEYIRVLTNFGNRVSDEHRSLFRVHYSAFDRTATAKQLASWAGITGGWAIVNSRYGKLGHAICDELGIVPQLRPNDKYKWWSVWSRGWNTPGGFVWQMLPKVAEALERLGWVEGGEIYLPEEIETALTFTEGSVCQRTVNAYERNPVARNRCIKHHGTNCCICGFSFGAVYGEEATGYIHVHHLRPLAEIGREYVVDPVEDLRPVCPNCHAVVHLGGRCRTTDEVKRLLERNKPA